MTKINLSVIVLSFNTKDITYECLTRLKTAVNSLEKNGKKAEVIVVDNASEDGSAEMLSQKHKWVNLIISKTNTGFSGGNNLAMKKVQGDYILLLNSDAFVESDTLVKALKFMDENADVDLIGVRLNFKDGRLQPCAGYLPTPLNTITWITGLALIPGMENLVTPYHPKDKSFFETTKQVEWVMGAFMMLKREVYQKTGGFDETIFMYGEEIEWCKRIKNNDFKTFFVSDIKVTHLDKASSNFLLEKPLLNELKGIKRYFISHYTQEWNIVRSVILISLILRIIVFKILGNEPRVKAYSEGLKIL